MQQSTFRLWQAAAPGALGDDLARDIPFLTTYLPKIDRASGASIIICPGGGYGGLSKHEGRDYAIWLNERGISAFVLNYRLGSHGYRYPVITGDLVRAMRFVRAHASDWGLDVSRIGVMGSSAGGHLVSTLLVHFDSGNPNAIDPVERVSSRPDFGILCYPVISMGPLTHAGSRENLLGSNPSPRDINFLSSELQVKKDTPPCFLWHTQEDDVVKVDNALVFALALIALDIPTSLHVYPSGPHGLGLGIRSHGEYSLHEWTLELDAWMQSLGIYKKDIP